MGDEGSVLGPELTRISDRFRGTRLLEHILLPSMEINKQYQSVVAITKEGQTVTGLIADRGESTLTLLPNPLEPESRVVLQRTELDEVIASPISTMPTGLLMVFEREEILDLLAYLQSAGNPLHRVFRQ